MIDPRKFKAPFLPKNEIWTNVEKVRKKYPRAQKLPVDILGIAEFDLKLKIEVEGRLREHCSVEAFLTRDMYSLYVDRDAFLDERRQARLRFSIAHELGHFFLHFQIFRGLKFSTIKDWVAFIALVPDAEYSWIEYQAYEFAGRLLVPPNELRTQFQAAVKKAEKAGFTNWDKSGQTALDFVSNGICGNFGVSAEVIAKRIKSEGLKPN